MRDINISHRLQVRGYLLVIEGVQETILMGADDLAFIALWCAEHEQELAREITEESDEVSRRLLDE